MDVAVIGAGPSGAWAAYHLATRGARVTIFDPSHPREKACGGGVTGRALALVSSAVRPASMPARAVTAARFATHDPHGDVVVPLPSGALVVVSRSVFDGAMLAAATRAGAELRLARAVDLDSTASGIRVRTADGTAWRANFVVGADGANSLVRRRLSRPFRRNELSIATGYFAREVTSDEIVVELTTDPAGYLWSFPRTDHLAIGICAQADGDAAIGALRARCATWIARRGLARGAQLDAYSWPIPSLSADDFASQQIAGDRWCLVGDAAGLVDPITREGIFFAIASGEWAADAITGSREMAADYTTRIQDEAVAELSLAAQLKAGFFRAAFTGLLMSALQESDAVRRVMADLVAGTQSYRMLKRRLLQTLELRIAWRALRTIGARGFSRT